MQSFIGYLQKLALVYWLGEILFFASIFAPRVFKVLPREWAATLQNNIFPAYFSAGILCGALIFICAVALRGFYDVPTAKHFWIVSGLAIFATLIFLYSRLIITPRLVSISQAGASARELPEFQWIHKLSVRLNGAALIALLALLAFV